MLTTSSLRPTIPLLEASPVMRWPHTSPRARSMSLPDSLGWRQSGRGPVAQSLTTPCPESKITLSRGQDRRDNFNCGECDAAD